MSSSVAHFSADAERNAHYRRPELVAPMVVWLASRECSANGEIFEAFCGRAARVVVAEPVGLWDADLRPSRSAQASPSCCPATTCSSRTTR